MTTVESKLPSDILSARLCALMKSVIVSTVAPVQLYLTREISSYAVFEVTFCVSACYQVVYCQTKPNDFTSYFT